MRRLALLLLAPLAFALPTPASASPLCVEVVVLVNGTEIVNVAPCVPYGGGTICSYHVAAVGTVVVAGVTYCVPAP